jgi:3-deoxy-D-manno-octulosonic-acid transferase
MGWRKPRSSAGAWFPSAGTTSWNRSRPAHRSCSGHHTGHVAEIAQALLAAGAGERVHDARALARRGGSVSSADAAARERMAESGRALLAANRGALDRSVDLILDVVRGGL